MLTHINFLLWNIWKHRCFCIFNSQNPNSDLVAVQAFEASSKFLQQSESNTLCHSSSSTRPRPPPKPKWIAPKGSSLKINCDTSWLSNSKIAGIAAIARNSARIMVAGFNCSLQAPTSLFAEALAACLGLFLVQRISSHSGNLVSFTLEIDSLHLFNLITNSSLLSEWAVAPLIDIIRDKIALPSSSWRWSSRNSNCAADLVAHLSCRNMCAIDWLVNPPCSLVSFVYFI